MKKPLLLFGLAAVGLSSLQPIGQPVGQPIGQTAGQSIWHSAWYSTWFPTSASSAASAPPALDAGLAKSSHILNDIASQIMPSVVAVTAIKLGTRRPEQTGMSGIPHIPEPEDTIPGAHAGPLDSPDPPPRRMLGIASGVVIRKDGFILTNHHVVEDAEKVTVAFDDKHKLSAHVVGIDPKTDLAVIRLDEAKNDLVPIAFGDSDQIKIGDWAIAIGNPFGLSHTMTSGIISAKGRAQMGMLDIEDFIQTDAALNPGSSGGPLLNSKGEMVGLNTAIFSESGNFAGIGFAIPSKLVKQVTDELIEKGHVVRGYIGLVAQDVLDDLAGYFKVKPGQGALISDVQAGGPASQSDFKVGDIVLSYNHVAIDGSAQFKSLVGKSAIDKAVPVEISRDGKHILASVKIREQPLPPEVQRLREQAGQVARPHPPSLGLVVQDIPPEISRILGISAGQGAIVSHVSPEGAAFDSGLIPGDIILNANHREIHSAHDFKQATQGLSDHQVAVLYVRRLPDEKIYVSVRAG